MDYILEKLPFPPWGTSVSQRIEITINSFLSLEKPFESKNT